MYISSDTLAAVHLVTCPVMSYSLCNGKCDLHGISKIAGTDLVTLLQGIMHILYPVHIYTWSLTTAAADWVINLW